MKRLLTIMLLLSVFAFPSILFAADPIIGTWKLNVSKSKYPSNEKPPREVTETYREIDGGRIELTYEGIEDDGTKFLFKATWPVEGGLANIIEGQANPKRSYVETLLEPGNWYVTVLDDGKQTGVMHKIFSRDGKIMTQTSTSVDEEGKKVNIVRVYEKQ